MNDTENPSERRLSSVTKSFEIVEHLHEHGPLTLSEVADDFDMPMSTAHIHLATLRSSEYVIKSGDEYRCSFRFLRTGGKLRDELPLFRAAKHEIDDIQDVLGEYANIGTMENGYMIQLYKSRNSSSIDDHAPLGSHLHLHSTSTGKAMLSRLPEDEVDEIIAKRGLPKETAATIVDRDELFDELAAVRERGYSINRGEHYSGVCAVGVPILSKDHDVAGAISVSGPASRMDDDRITDEIVPVLTDKQNVIELKLKQ